MSIVEKMARAIYASEGKCYADENRMFQPFPWEQLDDDDYQCVRESYRDKARAALTATGLTEAQLEGLANGTMVVVPGEPTEAMCQNAALQVLFTDWCDLAEDDKVGLLHVYRAMLAAKEG